MGHPALKQIARPVTNPPSNGTKRLLDDMRETIESVNANGLAAPQIDVNQRVVVYRIPEMIIPPDSQLEPVPWTYMINPKIEILSTEKRFAWERCLSLPGLYGKVPRFNHVYIRYETLMGDTMELEARGFHAMILQHECDHLDGVLYPMRMTDMSHLTYASEFERGATVYDFSQ